MNNKLRIISGQWKRKQLSFANVDGLRPTPDRVRETLFNWLMWDIQQADVLDVCTGSGALAFEALSRGAKHITMIEPSREQARFLNQNIQLLNTKQATLLQTTAQIALEKIQNPFDVIFLDPPYQLNLWQELATLIDPLLKNEGYIYIEADRNLNQLQLPTTWVQQKQLKAGIIHAGLYQKINN